MSPKIVVEWIESIQGEISVTQACAWQLLLLPRYMLLFLWLLLHQLILWLYSFLFSITWSGLKL